jgi:hypothetical protein
MKEQTTQPFKSKINPKPDPKDMSISTFKYETNLKAYETIETLSIISHDQWQYWSMQIMKDLDELIMVIAEQDKALSPYYSDTSVLRQKATNMIKKHNERNARWQKQWVAYKHLPEEVKESDRIWAKKAYTTMSEKR